MSKNRRPNSYHNDRTSLGLVLAKPVYDAYTVGDKKTGKDKLSGFEELKPLMYRVRHTLA